MSRTTLEQWRMFKAVVDFGGFAQAAEAIHKSQSTINHAVHKLQEVLDVRLLEVRGRKAHLTEAGELMLRRASYLLEDAGRIESIARSLNQGEEQSVRLAVDSAYIPPSFYRAIETLSNRFPDVQLELFETAAAGIETLMNQERVDLAVSTFPIASGLCEELHSLSFIAVANPAHALHRLGRKLSMDDLKSKRQIVCRDFAAESMDSNSQQLRSDEYSWYVDNVNTAMSMVSRGLGYAWLPQAEIVPLIQQGVLKPLPLQRGLIRTTMLYLSIADQDRLGPVASALLAELRRRSVTETGLAAAV